MTSASEIYQHIQARAPQFYQQTKTAARAAHNEAEFEHALNNAIAEMAQVLGVDLLFRQQYTLATGRADAVYNRFVSLSSVI